MKIHYNPDFECLETTECHIVDDITLDGTKLIPITEAKTIVREICNHYGIPYNEDDEGKRDSAFALGHAFDYSRSEMKHFLTQNLLR